MSASANSSSLNSEYINVTFSLKDVHTIRAQLPIHFELADFIEVIQAKLGAAAVDECYFFLNGEELLLGDLAKFQTQKDLITNECNITVDVTVGYTGQGCISGEYKENLKKAWTDATKSPDATFTNFKPSETSSSSDVVSFYPVERKGANYLRYCTGWLSANEKPASIRDCVWRYTSESGWFCTTVNLALATDSPDLQTYGEYIKHLKYSIGMSPMNYTGTVYRGVELSSAEVAAYESKDRFFIPSFTSTSKSNTAAFKKNSIFHIDITPQWSKYCMEITPEFTKYSEEVEVLFSCYNVYQYHRTEWNNGKRIIKLSLLDYEENFNYVTNSFVPRADTRQNHNLDRPQNQNSWIWRFWSWFS